MKLHVQAHELFGGSELIDKLEAIAKENEIDEIAIIDEREYLIQSTDEKKIINRIKNRIIDGLCKKYNI